MVSGKSEFNKTVRRLERSISGRGFEISWRESCFEFGISSETEYFETKASGPNPSCNNPGDDDDDDVITDPNNDSDEDKRRKGK